MKRRASSSSRDAQCTAGATAADAIDLDAVTELTYRRLEHEGPRSSASPRTPRVRETAAQRLARIVQTNRDFTAEDYEALLLLDRNSDDDSNGDSDSKSETSKGGSTRVVAMPCDDVVLHDRAEVQLAGAADCAACAVCLDALAVGQCVWQLPRCGHVFHARCVARWFDECAARPLCPICRAPHPCIHVAVHPVTRSRDDENDKEEEEEEEEEGEEGERSEPAKKKTRRSKSTPGHHGARKHERGRDGHEHRHTPRQQRSAHCCSWVERAPGVHTSFGPQTTLHAKFRALGQPHTPVAHILPPTPGTAAATTAAAAAHTPSSPSSSAAPASSAAPDVVVID